MLGGHPFRLWRRNPDHRRALQASSDDTGAFGWAGEQVNPDTGQVHLRARQYAPG